MFFKMLFSMLFVFGREAFSGLTSYGDAVTTGVFDQTINIDYGDAIFYNKSLNARLLTVLTRLGAKPAKTTIVKGFQQKVSYNVLSQTGNAVVAAGSSLVLTLGANASQGKEMKNQVQQGTTLELTPNPDGVGYNATTHTHYVYVLDKTPASDPDNRKITVVPINPALGINPCAASSALYVLGSWYHQMAGSPKPISMHPTVIDNYVQLLKTPYEYSDMAAAENLYVKGTLKQRLDDHAKRMHLIGREMSLLMNGPKYRDTQGGGSDDTDIGYQQGIIYSIVNAGGRAVKQYDSGTWDYAKFKDWAYKLFDPEIDDEPGKRFVPCNKAAIEFFTDLESQRIVKITPNGTYGIPGIRSVETSWGMFDLMMHPRIDERWKDMANPVMIALHLGQIEHKPYIPTYLAANIQNPDVTGKKSEYRTAEAVLVYNAETHHGAALPIL